MDLTIGQRLKQLREAKGVSLEEVSQETRIRMKYLRAIEANDIESLPSPMQMRGFLRLYASILGVEMKSLNVEGYHLTEESQHVKSLVQPSEDQPLPPVATPSQFSQEQKDEIEEAVEMPIALPQERRSSPIEPEPVIESNQTLENGILTVTPLEIFRQIGEKLQKRRNLISLSLDDIKSQLHIQKHYLKAMESGDFNALPSSIQAKGMLANYANFLSLDADALLLDFAEGLQKQHLEKTKTSQKKNLSAKAITNTALKLRNFFSLDLLVIAAIFIGFATFVIWGVNRILESDSPVMESTTLPEVADVLLASSSPMPQTSTLDATGGTETGDEAPVLEETPLFTPAVNDSPINIVVVPLQQTWVRVYSDSELVYEGRLLPGSAYDYSGEDKVEILTGNAAALQLYYNEQNLGSIGLIGQVANLIFTKDGFILPTPTHTPTFPETPEISPTPTITPSPSPSPSETNDQEG